VKSEIGGVEQSFQGHGLSGLDGNYEMCTWPAAKMHPDVIAASVFESELEIFVFAASDPDRPAVFRGKAFSKPAEPFSFRFTGTFGICGLRNSAA
jgi:hypothetical protein